MDCQPSVTNWHHFGISELLLSVSPRWQAPTFDSLRTHRDGIFGPTENPNVHYIWTFGLTEFPLRSHRDCSIMCVTVGFCVEAIYTPPPPLHSWREPSERTTTPTLHFLRRELPTLVLRSSCSIPTIWNLISNLPKLLSTQSFLPPQHISEVSWVLGRLSFEAQEQGVHHHLQHLLPFGGWCLLDWLGVAWEPPSSRCGVEPRSL